jgi:hypothetical protein
MIRAAIKNMQGHWFDVEKAIKFEEESWHNGNNYISKATESQLNHENLFFTATGKWVINKYSQYQNQLESYEVITEDEAVVWFLKQEMDLPEQLAGKDQDYEI